MGVFIVVIRGTINFVHRRGYGFITADDGAENYAAALKELGLHVGDKVEYRRVPSRKKAGLFEAADVRRLEGIAHVNTGAVDEACRA
jgi:cold shock CspA family protein